MAPTLAEVINSCLVVGVSPDMLKVPRTVPVCNKVRAMMLLAISLIH